jgi:hypothetical protein
MGQSPSLETGSPSANEEIPHLSCNPMIDYCVHKGCSEPVCTLTSHFIKLYLNTLPTYSYITDFLDR